VGPPLLTIVRRAFTYLQKNGSAATLTRVKTGLSRLAHPQLVIFFCELPVRVSAPRSDLLFERVSSGNLAPNDFETITSFWNRDLSASLIQERFRRGATLWLARQNGKLAGYGWTLLGMTMEPYFFPLVPSDLHLFDFLVFPQFRGLGINPQLVSHILSQAPALGATRAYVEVAVWNQSQLVSLKKTAFKRLGIAARKRLFKRTFAVWRSFDSVSQSV
jgi:ribosomal protein S18 acetylase RimI-like enzyme